MSRTDHAHGDHGHGHDHGHAHGGRDDQPFDRGPIDPARPLAGQVALVTGAARGIGRAIAEDLAAHGARVVIADLDGGAAAGTASAIRRAGGDAAPLWLDVTDPDAVGPSIGGIDKVYKRLDLVICNAGVAGVTPLVEMSFAEWRRVLSVNLDGAFLVLQAAAMIMRDQAPDAGGRRGRIITIGSGAGEIGRPYLAAYGASKAGLRSLTASAAAFYGPEGIAISTVYPTTVGTAMWEGIGERLGPLEGRSAAEETAARSLLQGRLQESGEVAEIVRRVAAAPGMAFHGQVVWSGPHGVALG